MEYSLTKLSIARKCSLIIFGIVLQFLFQSFYAIPAYSQTPDTLWSEDWEAGIGSWYADNGVWDAGEPTVGPEICHSGINCAATVLNGNYPGGSNSRLISPYIVLSSVSGDEQILLKFWQWFRFSDDYGHIQISVDGGEWQTLNDPRFDGYTLTWTQYIADLTAYSGSTVRIGFLFTSGSYNTDNGWYIDDILIEKKIVPFNNPEDFESGIGDWSADNGLWEAGEPGTGPTNTHSGENCVGTEINGNYHAGGNSRLISPSLTLSSVSGDEKILLKFWQWFRFSDDYGHVQISVDGGEWQTLNDPRFDGYSLNWTQYIADLTAYSGSTVRIGFLFTSGSYNTDNGWYIDDILIEKKIVPFNNPEDFESGIGDWSADNGLWEVGKPTWGDAHSGENCAATVLDGNYHAGGNSCFISPEILLEPEAGKTPMLFFWHKFNFSDDYGYVKISVNNGIWETIAGPYDGSSPEWTQGAADLNAYSDSLVRIAFCFYSGSYNNEKGWYIDDLRIEGIKPQNYNNTPIVYSPITDISFAEDSGQHTVVDDLYTVFSDPDGDDLTFNASSDNPDIQPSIKDDSLFVDSSPDYFGSGNMIVTATDPGGLSARDTFLVEITPVDDLPGSFSLLQPLNGDTLVSIDNPINFAWTSSKDLDNDTIVYNLYIFAASLDTTITDISDTTYSFDGSGVLLAGTKYQWTVLANDGNTVVGTDTFLFITPPPDAIGADGNSVPLKFSLSQNYPNPFNPVTQIKFGLPKASKVKLEVYNVLGQKVATLLKDQQAAGNYEVQWKPRNLPSGIYIITLLADDFCQKRKAVLIK